MKSLPIETEIKLYVPDHTAVMQRLQGLGAVCVSPRVFERNLRYENARNELIFSGTVLRLREDTRTRLTYKFGGQVYNGIVSRTELEVEVSDFDTMHRILEQLGYFVFMTYEKYRTTYEWDGAEIVLDELPYGNFVEIEGDVETIERVVQTLELTDANRYPQSYARLFTIVKRNLRLDFEDLTFANFENRQVPENAFIELTE